MSTDDARERKEEEAAAIKMQAAARGKAARRHHLVAMKAGVAFGATNAHAKSQAMDRKRAAEARSMVKACHRASDEDPLKICVMIRIKRLFNVSLASESFTVMMHVISW